MTQQDNKDIQPVVDSIEVSNFLTNLDEIIPQKDTDIRGTIGLDLLNPQDFSDIKDDEKLDMPELYYKKATSRSILKANYRLAFSIDPSEKGSGFAIYDNREGKELLHTGASTLSKIEDTKKDPLNYFKMQKELADDILELLNLHVPDFNNEIFDLIIIEDTIMRHSPQVFKRLVLINHVIDHLIGGGVLKTERFIRVNNKSWKPFLFSYKTGKQYKNDKLEIEETLKYLEEPLVLESYHETKAWKDKTHYQDKLDALSMLIVGLDVDEHYKTSVTNVKRLTYKYKILYEIPEDSVEITLVDTRPKTLEDTLKSLRSEKVKKKYYIRIKRNQLGSFGISNNLVLPLGVEDAILYIY